MSGAPSADCSVVTLLNKTHLVGLLLARHSAACSRSERDPGSLEEIIGSMYPLLCLFQHRVYDYTLRELRDSLQNIQLHWNSCNAVEIANIEKAEDALFVRFGVLAARCWPMEILDDQGSIEEGPSGWAGDNCTGVHMNRICIRRFLNVFIVLYRHIYLFKNAVRVHSSDTGEIKLNVHHCVAGADDFEALSMHWDLMPSARLNYVHDFPGMYNCVSQVNAPCARSILMYVI